MSQSIGFWRLVHFLWREEVRVQKVMTGGPAFWFFPFMIAIFGSVLGASHPVLLRAVSFHVQLRLGSLLFMIFGISVGGLGLFMGSILERRFGRINLLLASGRTLPIENRKLMGAFFLKDAFYYLAFNLLPFIAAFGLAGFVAAGFTFLGILLFAAGVILTFFFGMSLSYFLSMTAVKSRTVAGALTVVTFLVILAVLMDLLPGELLLPAVPLVSGENVHLALPSVALTMAFIALGTGMTVSHITPRGVPHTHAFLARATGFGRFGAYAPLLAKEWLDLRRSGTLGPVVGSFAGPVLLLAAMNWFFPALSGGDIAFPATFFAPLIGFFCITTYSWLNNIDSPGFYRVVPVRLPAVIRTKIILFFLLVAFLPALFVLLLSAISGDMSSIWLSLLIAYSTAVYVLAVTCYLTGISTNSLLFDARVLARFCLAILPPLILLSFLSLSGGIAWMGGDAATALVSLLLVVLSAPLFAGIDKKWSDRAFG
ncbi:MAG: hypothetical protein JSW28_01265 [Thermoplasmata archaeon]|nr:MAG: hypothetical protein JSW28_01265 [Thermoplasmata archaeon]